MADFRRLETRAVVCLHEVTANSNRQRSRLETTRRAVAERRARVMSEKSESAMCDFFAIRKAVRVDVSWVKFASKRGISRLEMQGE